MGKTPLVVLRLLAVAGNFLANYMISAGWTGGIPDYVQTLVINVGSILFLYVVETLQKIGANMDLFAGIIQAVEEQTDENTTGSVKLERALDMLGEEIKKRNMPFYIQMMIKPVAKFIISASAKPLKKLLYSTPPR